MNPTKASESFAKSIIQKELSLPVYQHDIGEGGYDLRVSDGAFSIAVEVKRLVSESYMELVGTTINHKHTIATTHNWEMLITKDANLKKIEKKALPILSLLENKKIDNYIVSLGDRRVSPHINMCLKELSVLRIDRYTSELDEKQDGNFLRFSIEGESSCKTSCVKTLIQEVENYIHKNKYAQTWKRLSRSNDVNEAHIFIIVGMRGISKEANSWFVSERYSMPDMPPKLPEGITGLWIVGLKRGLYWTPAKGWIKINKGTF